MLSPSLSAEGDAEARRAGARGSWEMEMDASVALRRRPLKLITNAGQCLRELPALAVWQYLQAQRLEGSQQSEGGQREGE